MKTLLRISCIFFLLTLFVACENDDGYSLNKYWIDIATVENPDSTPVFFFRLDNNDLMWTAATNFHNYRPKDGQRIIANYTKLFDKRATGLYDYDVRLNDVYNVLTKGIFSITPANQDSIGNDSIQIDDIWIGRDYLNVEFIYRGNNKIHYINLVADSSKVYTDGKIHLEFRHNANGDAPVYHKSGIVSFNLKQLQTGGPAVNTRQLVIHVNVPNQALDKTYELTYKFGGLLTMYRAPKITIPLQKNYSGK